jgi:hypothetical protein
VNEVHSALGFGRLPPGLISIGLPDLEGNNWETNSKKWETIHANRLNVKFPNADYVVAEKRNQTAWDLIDRNGNYPLVQAKTVTTAYSYGGSKTLWDKLTKPLLDASSDGEGYLSFLILDKQLNVAKHFVGSVHLIPKLNTRGNPQQNITLTQPAKWGFSEVVLAHH